MKYQFWKHSFALHIASLKGSSPRIVLHTNANAITLKLIDLYIDLSNCQFDSKSSTELYKFIAIAFINNNMRKKHQCRYMYFVFIYEWKIVKYICISICVYIFSDHFMTKSKMFETSILNLDRLICYSETVFKWIYWHPAIFTSEIWSKFGGVAENGKVIKLI